MTEQPVVKDAEPGGKSTSELNSPKVNETGQPTQRAITSAKQAHAIAKAIKDRAMGAKGRIATAATIADAYSAINPFRDYELRRAGQAGSNNFSTNFLGSIIDRVKPQITEPIKKATLLVHGALPDNTQNGAVKARKFNEVTTKTIRGWDGYEDFLDGLAQDVVLFGNSCPARVDEDWRPRLWRYDETFLPEGTGQTAGKVQIAAFTQCILIHDFLDLFKDPKIAKLAGYDIEGCVKAANSMAGSAQSEPTALQLNDQVRELSTIGYSYSNEGQTKTVDLFHVLVRDYTGEVDLWTVTQTEGIGIRNVQGIHKKMQDCVTLFTMQTGNRKYWGSKGLGRLLTNIHMAIERGRCRAADKAQLDGLPIVQGETSDMLAAQARVRFPFIHLPAEMKVADTTIQFNYDAFSLMDRQLTGIAESIAGAFIPPNVDNQGSSKTKIEAAQKAEREVAVRKGVLARFARQHTEMADMMKRAIFSPLNIREGKRAHDKNESARKSGLKVVARKVFDWLFMAFGKPANAVAEADVTVADPEAVGAVIELLVFGLTVDEIAALALATSSETNSEEGAERDNQTLQYIQLNKASPHVDQRKAAEMEANIVLGEDRAKQLLRPQPDMNNEAFAIRQQTIEFSEMLDGNPMPVVGDDFHELHRKWLAPQIDALVTSVAQDPQPPLIQAAQLIAQHYLEHIAADQTMQPPQKAEEEKVIRQYMAIVEKAAAAAEKAAQEQAQAAAQQPQPGAPPNPEQVATERDFERQTLVDTADIQLRQKESEQRDRELALKEQQQAHNAEKDAITLQQKNLEIATSVQKAERDAEIKAKQAEQKKTAPPAK